MAQVVGRAQLAVAAVAVAVAVVACVPFSAVWTTSVVQAEVGVQVAVAAFQVISGKGAVGLSESGS